MTTLQPHTSRVGVFFVGLQSNFLLLPFPSLFCYDQTKERLFFAAHTHTHTSLITLIKQKSFAVVLLQSPLSHTLPKRCSKGGQRFSQTEDNENTKGWG